MHHLRKLSIISMLAVLLVACGGGESGSEGDGGTAAPDDQGTAGGETSGDPIVVGGIFDLSGATGDVGTPYAEGVRDYVEWRNADGGLAGRPIQLEWQDYAYDVATAEQLYSQFTSQGAVAIQGWGTGDTEALRGLVTQDEIPFMSAS